MQNNAKTRTNTNELLKTSVQGFNVEGWAETYRSRVLHSLTLQEDDSSQTHCFHEHKKSEKQTNKSKQKAPSGQRNKRAEKQNANKFKLLVSDYHVCAVCADSVCLCVHCAVG